jgi:hypothetical protein
LANGNSILVRSKMLLKIVILCLAASFVAADVEFDHCKVGNAPLRLHIAGCSKQPCHHTNGDDLIMDFDFITRKLFLDYQLNRTISLFFFLFPAQATSNLTAAIVIRVFGLPFEFELPDEAIEACLELTNTNCPLKKGQFVNYAVNLPIESPVAGPKINIEFKLLDETGYPASCFKGEVKIDSKPVTESVTGV